MQQCQTNVLATKEIVNIGYYSEEVTWPSHNHATSQENKKIVIKQEDNQIVLITWKSWWLKNHHLSGDQQHNYQEHGIEVDGMVISWWWWLQWCDVDNVSVTVVVLNHDDDYNNDDYNDDDNDDDYNDCAALL